ncbi:MAG: hypothetical protein R2911_13690 [Caldilineaceae bacterium]
MEGAFFILELLPQNLNQFESPIVTPSFVLTSPLASAQTNAQVESVLG